MFQASKDVEVMRRSRKEPRHNLECFQYGVSQSCGKNSLAESRRSRVTEGSGEANGHIHEKSGGATIDLQGGRSGSSQVF